MSPTPWLTRLARRCILDVRQGNAPATLAVLTEISRHEPAVILDLLAEIARHVDDTAIAAIVADGPLDPADVLVSREAHRRRDRGDRVEWVLWGERLYQLLRRRRRGLVT